MSRTLKILLTVSIVAIGAGVLFYSSMSEAEFYKHVNQVLDEPARFENKTLKIHGFVEAGSIHEEIKDQATHRSFILEYEGKRIHVTHVGPKPDTFRDLSEVVARGTLVKKDGEYILEANDLMAKCPSKYEENKRSKQVTSAR